MAMGHATWLLMSLPLLNSTVTGISPATAFLSVESLF